MGALIGVLAAAVWEGAGAAGRLAGRALQAGLEAGWAFLRWVGPRLVALASAVGRAVAAGTSALLRNPLRELPDLPARAPAPVGTAEEGSGIRRPESLPTGRALGPLGVVVAGPRREEDGGLGSLAGGPPDLEVLAWATTAEDALSALREVGRRRKVMVVVDLDLSGEQDARWLIRTIREKLPHIRILVVGSEASPQAVTQALLVGGDGFLRATAAPEEVVEAIRRTAAGEVVLEGLPVGAGRPGPSPPPTRRPRPPGPSSPG
jgi:CheY-like chemotaxis protein